MTPQELLDKIEQYANAVAEAEGQNLEYCPSVDFTLLPDIVACTLDAQGIVDWLHSYEYNLEVWVGNLHFLAENSRVLPKYLSDSSFKYIYEYINEYRERIFDEILDICKGYYDEYVGEVELDEE